MATVVAPNRGPDRSAGVRAVLLRPVVTELPAAATSLYTLLSVGPEARQAMFGHVAEDAARLDAARASLMARLTALPEDDRAPAIRLAQSSSLLGRHMLAVARVAAQGHAGRLPTGAAEHARVVVGITERVAAVELGGLPAQRSRTGGRLTLPQALRQLHGASNELDAAMWQLTTARAGTDR